MKVLLAATDLLFASKVRETARNVGAELRQVREGFGDAVAAEPPDLVLVDLSATAFDPLAAIREVRARSQTRIIAFVNHERADLIAAAREAGCHEVLARGAFAARLPQLLGAPPA